MRGRGPRRAAGLDSGRRGRLTGRRRVACGRLVCGDRPVFGVSGALVRCIRPSRATGLGGSCCRRLTGRGRVACGRLICSACPVFGISGALMRGRGPSGAAGLDGGRCRRLPSCRCLAGRCFVGGTRAVRAASATATGGRGSRLVYSCGRVSATVPTACGGGTGTGCVRVTIIVRLVLRGVFGVVILALAAVAVVTTTTLALMSITGTMAVLSIAAAGMEDDDFLSCAWLAHKGRISAAHDRDEWRCWML
jgi:hypothetical protein